MRDPLFCDGSCGALLSELLAVLFELGAATLLFHRRPEYSAEAGYSYGTVVGDIFALRSRSIAIGIPAPVPLAPFTKRLLAGYKKLFPPGAGKRLPLLAEDLRAFLTTLHTSLRGRRDGSGQTCPFETLLWQCPSRHFGIPRCWPLR